MVKKEGVKAVVDAVSEVDKMVTDLVTRAHEALKIMETFDQAKVDCSCSSQGM